MVKFDKKKILLFVLWFFLVFFVYYFTLSSNMSTNSDYLQLSLEVENISLTHGRAIAHILWVPLGKLVYSFARWTGYSGGSIKPVEIFNIFLASLGSALFLILIYELTGNLPVSICLSILLSFSLELWMEFVHTKFYSGGFLFNILSFYLYSREDFKFKPILLAVANSLAVLFHFTNIGVVICSFVYFLISSENIEKKTINILSFFLVFMLIFFGCYYLIYLIFPFYFIGTYGYGVSWLTFFRFHYPFLYVGSYEEIKIDTLILGCVVYSGLFLYLFITSYKKLLKERLFYLSLIFGILLLLIIKITGPTNANFSCFFISFNIILALLLKDYQKFSLSKKIIISIVLIFCAVFLLFKNFPYMYSSKDLSSDQIYQVAVEKPKDFLAPDDVVFASGIIPYYLEYYVRCKVDYLAGGYKNNDEAYNSFVSEINFYLGSGEKVKIFLDKTANEEKIVKPFDILEIDYLLMRLSEDFRLKLLYKTAGKDKLLRDIELYEIRKKL